MAKMIKIESCWDCDYCYQINRLPKQYCCRNENVEGGKDNIPDVHSIPASCPLPDAPESKPDVEVVCIMGCALCVEKCII
jgi:hypothetical protein